MITIIMPAYNCEKYLRDAVESVKAQTYKNWTLFIIDDCSTDGTRALARALAETDERIKVFHNKQNVGVARTRNCGVRKAESEWVAFLDSDDMWTPDKLEKQIKLSEKIPVAKLIFTGSGFITESGEKIDYVLHAPDRIDRSELLKQNLISCSSVLLKRDLMLKYPMPGKGYMHEDFASWLRILGEEKYAYGIDEPLLIYRLSKSSRSGNKLDAAVMNWNTYQYVRLDPAASLYYMGWYTLKGLQKYSHLNREDSDQSVIKEKSYMRIAIIGPVTTKSYFGGVATFDENLAVAFSNIGHKVILLSSQADLKEGNIHGIPVRRISLFNAKDYKADIAICSLGDVKYLPSLNAKFKIAFLHGFFSTRFYGTLKAMAGMEYQKFFFRNADAVVANSEFTRFMNNEAAGISTDGSVSLGVSYDFIDELKKEEGVEREAHSILFTGRLVNVKRVDRILEAVKILKDRGQNYHLYIVGDGPEREGLVQYNSKYDLGATFVGKVDQKKIVEYYKRSEIFISLNESEPYGITFCEALLAGCKIICPGTGGQVEYLRQYPNTARILQDDSPKQISEAVSALSDNNKSDPINLEDFTYERTARELLNIVKRKRTHG